MGQGLKGVWYGKPSIRSEPKALVEPKMERTCMVGQSLGVVWYDMGQSTSRVSPQPKSSG